MHQEHAAATFGADVRNGQIRQMQRVAQKRKRIGDPPRLFITGQGNDSERGHQIAPPRCDRCGNLQCVSLFQGEQRLTVFQIEWHEIRRMRAGLVLKPNHGRLLHDFHLACWGHVRCHL